MIVKTIQTLENKMESQINSLETRIEKMQERFNKDLEEIKKSQYIMNNALSEIKHSGGKLVLVFWWVGLDFFSLECNEVSSNEL